MTNAYEAENLEAWERLIGRAILAFGGIEFLLCKLYERYLQKRIYADDNFETRFNSLIGVLKKHDHIEIADILISIKKVWDFRHLIAHNPIDLEILPSVSNEPGVRHCRLCIRQAAGSSLSLDFCELRDLVAQCNDLKERGLDAYLQASLFWPAH